MLSNCFRDPTAFIDVFEPLKACVQSRVCSARGFIRAWTGRRGGERGYPLCSLTLLPRTDFLPLWYIVFGTCYPNRYNGAGTPWYTRVIMAVTCIVRIVDSPRLLFDLRIIECAAPARKYVIAILPRYRLGRQPETWMGLYRCSRALFLCLTRAKRVTGLAFSIENRPRFVDLGIVSMRISF